MLSQVSYTYSQTCMILGVFYVLCFTRRVSLVEYILVLRVYFHLLQMISFMMALQDLSPSRWG